MLQTLALIGAGILYGSGSGYVWPLALEPQLTSSFAEYRAGRFHAGIDLRTAGVGRDVFAAGDGYVSRVRCSPTGYGKAVYLQLADGNVAIYAHLSDFYPELAQFVRDRQHQDRDYTVDLQLKPSQFPIQRGQLIAVSGQTGIGAPHLHYELRDAAQEPVNPRLLGLDWPDGTPPRISKILVAARGLDGRVNGDVEPVVLDVTQDEQGRYRTPPVHLQGMIGFGADVIDPGSGGYNLGIHRLRLLENGDEPFRMQHDRMSYTNHRNGAVSYHPYVMDRGRFLLLWRWPGNRCHSYQHSPRDGWVNADTAPDAYVVEAADFHGNTVQVSIPVLKGRYETPANGSPSPAVDMHLWGPEMIISAELPAASTAPPLLAINNAPGTPFLPVGATGYRAAFRPERSGVFTLSVTHASLPAYTREVGVFVQGQPATTLELDGVRVAAGPGTPYGALFLRAWKAGDPPGLPMPARSEAYQLWPANAPFFDPLVVSFPLDDGVAFARNIHVYRHQGAYWSREDTTFRNGRLEFEPRSPGLFVAMEDTEAPSFANVSPPEGFVAQTRRPEIRADVSDNGSGIRKFELTCGGAWLIAEYDPERNQLFWAQDEDLPPGPQTLTFTLTDEAGNSRTLARQITVPN